MVLVTLWYIIFSEHRWFRSVNGFGATFVVHNYHIPLMVSERSWFQGDLWYIISIERRWFRSGNGFKATSWYILLSIGGFGAVMVSKRPSNLWGVYVFSEAVKV